MINTYGHDCAKCIMLAGEVRIDDSHLYDVYVHRDMKYGPAFDSIIVRYGDEPHEYYSYPPSDMIMSAAHGLAQGLWAQHHKVKGAGYGFVTLGNGEMVSFRPSGSEDPYDPYTAEEIEDRLDLALASNKELRSQSSELARQHITQRGLLDMARRDHDVLFKMYINQDRELIALREMLSVCRQQIESLEKARV
jgi:hypothetical protein